MVWGGVWNPPRPRINIWPSDVSDVCEWSAWDLYANDTTIYHAGKNPNEVTNTLNSALSSTVDWIEHNDRLKMKTQLMMLGLEESPIYTRYVLMLQYEEQT